MTQKSIPDIVVGRLPRYLRALEYMLRNGIKTTSSQELGESIGISAAQIRKDLSQFGEFGKQGTGYSVRYLVDQLQAILHVNQSWDLVLVGVGDLGTALAAYQGFINRGFHIVLAFDNNPIKVGKKIGGLPIYSMEELEKRVSTSKAKIAMLTVPASAAQETADKLIKSGIRAILNYAPMQLNVPSDIHVEYIDPVTKLQHMTYYLG
ncbi:MAG TPA: redox-sensing transcriptional repressor Rex [Bellilinea sp.]